MLAAVDDTEDMADATTIKDAADMVVTADTRRLVEMAAEAREGQITRKAAAAVAEYMVSQVVVVVVVADLDKMELARVYPAW